MDKKKLAEIKAAVEVAQGEVSDMHSELEEAFGEKSKNWQSSDAGEKAQEKLGHLQDALDGFEVVTDSLEAALS